MAYKKKIFISYDYTNDKHYKNLLLAWDANKLFNFSISDKSADVGINSSNVRAIKSVLSRYINTSTYFLVIVGKSTHESDWVKWEIKKAVKLKKRIIAVKTDKENISPSELFGVGAAWSMSFAYQSIINAIENA